MKNFDSENFIFVLEKMKNIIFYTIERFIKLNEKFNDFFIEKYINIIRTSNSESFTHPFNEKIFNNVQNKILNLIKISFQTISH